MKIASLARCFALRGGLMFVALGSGASAQNQDWVRQFGSTAVDVVLGTAPDGSGGVFVSGSTRGNLGGPNAGYQDVWLARYDASGNQSWVRQFGSSRDEAPYAAATDGSGGVYLSGSTRGALGGPSAGDFDIWLARYDGAGNRTWIRQFGTSGFDTPNAAASDGAGGVYVCGETDGSLGGSNEGFDDAWIAHYDGAGNQTWIRQLGSSDFDLALAAASDGAGGVFVGGHTQSGLGGPSTGFGNDAWLARYDNAGNQAWMRYLATANEETLRAATPDGEGGVFVCGETTGSLGGPLAGQADAWLARFDDAGNRTWIRQFGTYLQDLAWAVAPAAAGGVFVTGRTSGSLAGPQAGTFDAWIARYDSAGNQSWIQQFGSSALDYALGVAQDGAGGAFVSGHTYGDLGGPNAGIADAWLAHYEALEATRYCTPAVANSTGQPGTLNATGTNLVGFNRVTLEASVLPRGSFGYFLTSRTQGYVVGAGGSQGDLCLGGALGRYSGAGQIMNSGATGSFSLVLDLTAMPTPTGFVAALPGETWNFQAWHRDANPMPTSNFTDALSVLLQ